MLLNPEDSVTKPKEFLMEVTDKTRADVKVHFRFIDIWSLLFWFDWSLWFITRICWESILVTEDLIHITWFKLIYKESALTDLFETIGRDLDSVPKQITFIGNRTSAQRERGGFQIGENVQIFQHKQFVGETVIHQTHHWERKPRFGGDCQSKNAGQRRQRHPAGNSRWCRHEMFRRIYRYHSICNQSNKWISCHIWSMTGLINHSLLKLFIDYLNPFDWDNWVSIMSILIHQNLGFSVWIHFRSERAS